MENQNDQSLFDLQIDSEGSNYLTETAKWAKLLSILGLIAGVLIIIVGLFFSMAGSSMATMTGMMQFGPIFGIIYVVIGAIYLYPSWKLLKFSNGMPQALQRHDQLLVNESLGNLKSCFRFFGIFALITIGLYILVIVGAIIYGVSQA